MLATVLKSDVAIEVNIAIIRTFVKLLYYTQNLFTLQRDLQFLIGRYD